MDNKTIENQVRSWVDSFVIGLNLCPFAKREILQERVRFVVLEAEFEEQLLVSLEAELERLNDQSDIETTLLIHPYVLKDFYGFNQFLDMADELLVEMELEGVYQIASFHPGYQFGGTDLNDAENYTNRSPYPILHILREASLAKAIDYYPDIDRIPERNIELMNEMGESKLKSLLQSLL